MKDPANFKSEVYEGDLNRLDMVMWIQSKAQKQLKKNSRELDRNALKAGSCTKEDKKYCLLAFYNSPSEKESLKRQLDEIASTFESDPINFFTVDTNAIKRSCVFETESIFYIVKAKRKKYEHIGNDLQEISQKIENKLSGSQILGKFNSGKDLLTCYTKSN